VKLLFNFSWPVKRFKVLQHLSQRSRVFEYLRSLRHVFEILFSNGALNGLSFKNSIVRPKATEFN